MRGENVTIASDVYSLGAVLYELLSESKPHRFANYTVREIERVICEEDSVRPSAAVVDRSLARRLRGDLDTIVMLALQKDPSRRYETVEHFVEDIRRHLEHLPVHARADTLLYRAGKLARRRAGWIAAAGAVTATLLGGLVVAIHEARLADERFQQVRRLANAFVFDVHDAVRPLAGSTRARALILKTGVEYLDALAASAADVELQSELAGSYIKIGDLQGDETNANLGNLAKAEENYEKARKLLDTALARAPGNLQARRQRFVLEFQTGRMRYAQRDRPGALSALQQAERDGEQLFREHPGDEEIRQRLAQTYAETGLVYRSTGEAKLTLEASRKAAALLDRAPAAKKTEPEFEYLAASNVSDEGLAEVMTGETAAGLAHLRTAAARLDTLSAAFPQNVDYAHQAMLTWSHIADRLHDLHDDAGATAAGEHFAAIGRRLHEADSADERAAVDYGIALTKVAALIPETDFAQRIELLRTAIPVLRKTTAANSRNTQARIFLAAGEVRLGDALQSKSDLRAAQREWQAGLNDAYPLLPTGQLAAAEICVLACLRLGEQAAIRHDRAAAEESIGRAWEVSDPQGEWAKARNPAQQRFLTARALGAVGIVRARLGDFAIARDWLTRSAARFRELRTDPGYNPTYQRLLDAVESELATLDRRNPKP